jgi:hypothetical protein
MTFDPAASPVQKAPNQGYIERQNPVPPGRYWIYIDIKEDARWQSWVREHSGKVKVIATEGQQAMATWLPAIFVTRWDLDIIKSTVGYWILFAVLEPVPWVGLGYPTTVPDVTVKSSTDIMTAPAPEPSTDLNPLGAVYDAVKTLLFIGGGIYIAGIVLQQVLTSSAKKVLRQTRSLPAGGRS